MPPFNKKKKDKKKKKKKNGNVADSKYYGEVVDEEAIKKSKKRIRAPVGASRLEPYVKKPRAKRVEVEEVEEDVVDESSDDDSDDVSVDLPAVPSLDYLLKSSKSTKKSLDSDYDSDDDDSDDDDLDDYSSISPSPSPLLPPSTPNPFFHTLPSSPPSLVKSTSLTSTSQTSILSPSPPPENLASAVSSYADVLVTGGKRQNEDAVGETEQKARAKDDWSEGRLERSNSIIMSTTILTTLLLLASLLTPRSLRSHPVSHILHHLDNVTTLVSKNDKKQEKGTEEDKELRDQGYSRSTVLILLPTRGVALDYINILLDGADENEGTEKEEVRNDEERSDRKVVHSLPK